MNPYPTVIGLTGPIGSGKDTVAALLRTHCAAHTFAFADALRHEIVEAFCIEHIYLTRRETKEHPMSALALSRCLDSAFVDRMVVHHLTHGGERLDLTAPRSPRQIMQWWGTEYRRAQKPGYWTQKALQTVRWLDQTTRPSLVVISDVRFADEAQLVRSLGGWIWQVKRTGTEVATGAHVSEVAGDEFTPDAVINNHHDMRHLQGVVLSAWAERAWGMPGVRVEVPA